jgi:hypothetical protein
VCAYRYAPRRRSRSRVILATKADGGIKRGCDRATDAALARVGLRGEGGEERRKPANILQLSGSSFTHGRERCCGRSLAPWASRCSADLTRDACMTFAQPGTRSHSLTVVAVGPFFDALGGRTHVVACRSRKGRQPLRHPRRQRRSRPARRVLHVVRRARRGVGLAQGRQRGQRAGPVAHLAARRRTEAHDVSMRERVFGRLNKRSRTLALSAAGGVDETAAVAWAVQGDVYRGMPDGARARREQLAARSARRRRCARGVARGRVWRCAGGAAVRRGRARRDQHRRLWWWPTQGWTGSS